MVGKAAGDHRQGGLHQGPPQEDETLIALAEVETAGFVGLGDIDGNDHPHAIISKPFDGLHDVGHPERPGQPFGLGPE